MEITKEEIRQMVYNAVDKLSQKEHKFLIPSIEVRDEVIIENNDVENPFGYVSKEELGLFLEKIGIEPEEFFDDD